MARKPIDVRISELKVKAKALEARKAQTERTLDTRRKVLLGTLIQRELGADTDMSRSLREWIARELPAFITRDNDRSLFSDLISDGKQEDHG